MTRNLAAQVYLAKALEHLAAAESEYGNHRYNTCAKLAYYAVFHAAVAALISAGAPLPRGEGIWSHAFVQAEFSRLLIHQRHRYSPQWREVLPNTLILRQRADYSTEHVSQLRSLRVLRQAAEFVSAVQLRESEGQ